MRSRSYAAVGKGFVFPTPCPTIHLQRIVPIPCALSTDLPLCLHPDALCPDSAGTSPLERGEVWQRGNKGCRSPAPSCHTGHASRLVWRVTRCGTAVCLCRTALPPSPPPPPPPPPSRRLQPRSLSHRVAAACGDGGGGGDGAPGSDRPSKTAHCPAGSSDGEPQHCFDVSTGGGC